MAASDPSPPDALRRTAAERVAEKALRNVAHQVGMRPAELQRFLSASEASAASRRQRREGAGQPPTARAALSALTLLVGDLPPARQLPGMERLALVLESHLRVGRRRPAWLVETRAEIRREAAARGVDLDAPLPPRAPDAPPAS